jgi:aurora kinase
VLIYELLVGQAPFEDMPILTKKRIATGDFQVPDSVSADAKDLIERVSHTNSN